MPAKPSNRRKSNRKPALDHVPTEDEMADHLSNNKQAALLALRDLRIAMRHVAGGQSLRLAYESETGGDGKNSNVWKIKPSAQYWLEAVQAAKEATDESIAAAIEGSQLLILADPEASHRDKTAAAALLAKVRGLDRIKVEVQKSETDELFESLLKKCQVKSFSQPDPNIIYI